MAGADQGPGALSPIDQTLSRVVLLMRLGGWVWLLILVVVAFTGSDPYDEVTLTWTMVVGTAGTALTVVAAKRGFLGRLWYLLFDGAIALLLSSAGWISGGDEFIVGGYPVSWLFILAFATDIRWSVVGGVLTTATFVVLHFLMDLRMTRVFGSVQFIVVALVVGWAFDALRERERLRLAAEQERAEAEARLADEQLRYGRLEERSEIARRLHDSVLQTLKLISAAADEASEVRYLARVQERDLRRTINEYQSPFNDSFRARLLEARAEIEDRYRVEIEQVIRDDAEMDDRLQAVVAATQEALNNAARHSGVSEIDLFCEIRAGVVQVNVRDRGSGFDPELRGSGGIAHSIVERVANVGGQAAVKSAPGGGTDVSIRLPL